jgi:aminoglycoside 3-N-acetyltransferase
MRTYGREQLDECLRGVGLTVGDVVLVHSALFALGQLAEVPTKEQPGAIYAVLKNVIGSEGTIVVPTFNFGFCRAEVFHRQQTPSEKMGIFSEHVRTLPGAFRSSHPMQSVAAVGPMAERICRPDTSSAFDVRGAFAMLLEYEAKMLFLGSGFVAASMVHYCEERVGVPYRAWKSFTGPYRDGEWESVRTYALYARDLSANPIVDPTPIGEALLEAERGKRRRLGSGFVEAIGSRDFVEHGVQLLRANRRALLMERAVASTSGPGFQR